MRLAFTAAPLLLLAAAALGGCARHSDYAAVGRFGGYTTAKYEGVFTDLPPVEAVDFSTQRAIVTDDDIQTMLPALKRLAPRRISLGGQRITDRSIDMLNEIPFLRVVNVEGTQVTPAGWARLRPSHWE